MATILKPTKSQQVRVMLRELLSPSMLIAYTVVLTCPYWVFPTVYFWMRTLLVAPSGLFICLFIIALSSYVVWAWGTWIVLLARRAKMRRRARKEALAGDEAAARVYLALRTGGAHSWRYASAFIGIQALIPPVVALILWQGMIASPGIVKDHGHFRKASPHEELTGCLKAWQRRGIFRALDSED